MGKKQELSQAQQRVLRSIAETGKLYAVDSRSYDALKKHGLVELINVSEEKNCWEGRFVLTDTGKVVLDSLHFSRKKLGE